ncbi:MAG: 3-hydroxybutyryl-CoA dehydrogenase [candidate division NC10 bacterium]|nr:3-hydroxybutyryl-CoA dehydrogenase [candidate division NC10 bacterium]MBI2116313.1 3-hydroxybutyryl-CoA dehydrogenase [candidate division NC10 bacterium]MBI2163962.1 3-hydroxybutyryl-CoA dehydrogenase [candidate division NC10 bacterium]MBI2458015.1 3-hydroxybutyryl-CoA dehydrogenase [candidate division NC10 bacterium]MBI2564028.1 3-hydroxybutyryl-CoA dehydrogenase [candidate division NC10 bacterium]
MRGCRVAIRKVGVVGCGLMGAGIAQVTAEAGYPVVVREVDQALLDRGLGMIEKNWARGVEKGKLTAEAKGKAAANLRGTLSLEDLRDCDLVIEAIIENIEEKKKLFAALDRMCPPETILASNTSSLTVIEMAMATGRPDRVCGLHFFNPVPVMKLVEVVRTVRTSEATFRAAYAFAKSAGKEPVAAKDNSGFIVNLLLVPYLLDAIRAVEAGVASVEDIDKGMKLGCGHPMGPLTLLDFVGLDTTYYIANIMFEEYRETRYAPPPLLKKMVQAGFFGKKSGRGFYDYAGPEPKVADLGI